MPSKRPNLSDRLKAAARGQEAVYANRKRSTTRKAAKQTKRWDEEHRRFTCHLPNELVGAIDREHEKSGRSKSQIVAEALRKHLRVS